MKTIILILALISVPVFAQNEDRQLTDRLDMLEAQIKMLFQMTAMKGNSYKNTDVFIGETADKKVSVSTNSTAGMLGNYPTNGVLQVDTNTMTYTLVDGGDAVKLSTYIYTGTNGAPSGAALPEGQYNGQVLWWNGTVWKLSDQPSDPSVLVFSDGEVKWIYLDGIYKGVFKDASGSAVSDYPRFH